VGGISIQRYQDQQQNRGSVDYVGKPADESVIKTYDDPINARPMNIHAFVSDKGLLPEIVQAVAGAVDIQKTDQTDRQYEKEQRPIKIEK